MRRETGLVMVLSVAALSVLWGCAGGPPPRDPEWAGYTWGGRSDEKKADPSQVQQQLTVLTTQLSTDLRARQAQRIAILPFENTSGPNPESLGAYLTEKITNLFYAARVGTVVERTYLKKVLAEIERGYSGPFDPRSLQEIGHLLNADTLILGSYTRLTNGDTEVMARAVSVETGEVVGAGSTLIAGTIVPNVPIVVREPLLAKGDAPPPVAVPAPRLVESPSTPGTFNIVPSPAPGMAYSTPQIEPATSYPAYPTPPVIVPPYGTPPGVIFPFYGFSPITRFRPLHPFSVPPFLAQPRLTPPFSSRPSGRHHSRR